MVSYLGGGCSPGNQTHHHLIHALLRFGSDSRAPPSVPWDERTLLRSLPSQGCPRAPPPSPPPIGPELGLKLTGTSLAQAGFSLVHVPCTCKSCLSGKAPYIAGSLVVLPGHLKKKRSNYDNEVMDIFKYPSLRYIYISRVS